MPSPDLDDLRKLLRSPEGEILRAYLERELRALQDIASVREFEHPFAQSVELQAQRKAYQTVRMLLERIGFALSDPKAAKDPRDSFAQ